MSGTELCADKIWTHVILLNTALGLLVHLTVEGTLCQVMRQLAGGGSNGTIPLDRESGHLTLTWQAFQEQPLWPPESPGRPHQYLGACPHQLTLQVTQEWWPPVRGCPSLRQQRPTSRPPFSPTQSLPNPTACESSRPQRAESAPAVVDRVRV